MRAYYVTNCVIFNDKLFGISTEGKILLKTIHVLVGYVFATNLLVRLVFAFIGKNNENLKATYVEGYNVQSKWTNDGEQLLYSSISSKDNFNPRLWIVNARGNTIGTNRIDLGLNTFADKCNFAGETTLYCAVPDSLERGVGLQPDVNDGVSDTIYKIDLKTGQKTTRNLLGSFMQ